MVICLERGADLHMAQLMPLPLTVFCFSKMQIGFTFVVPAHPGSPGQRAVKRVCMCVCVKGMKTVLVTPLRRTVVYANPNMLVAVYKGMQAVILCSEKIFRFLKMWVLAKGGRPV